MTGWVYELPAPVEFPNPHRCRCPRCTAEAPSSPVDVTADPLAVTDTTKPTQSRTEN